MDEVGFTESSYFVAAAVPGAAIQSTETWRMGSTRSTPSIAAIASRSSSFSSVPAPSGFAWLDCWRPFGSYSFGPSVVSVDAAGEMWVHYPRGDTRADSVVAGWSVTTRITGRPCPV